MLQQALTYAQQGWAVLPIWPTVDGSCLCGRSCGRTAGKHPIHILAPQGVQNATTDRETITRWWTRYPNANVAIATGERSGIFVVDIDAHHDGYEALAGLETSNGELPATRRAITVNGGMHIYFRWPGQRVVNTVARLGPGIDVRGDGGYVVAPPSVINDRKYEWQDPHSPVLEPPPWLHTMVVGSGVGGSVDPLEISAILNGVPEGARDVVLFRWASKLRAIGLPLEIAADLIAHAARKCDPPFDEDEARAKVDRVYAQYKKEHHLTDVGNMERLVERHNEDLRYCSAGYWLVWDGVRWNANTGHLVVPFAEETVRAILNEAAEIRGGGPEDVDKREALISHSMRSERKERIMAMVSLAESEPQIHIFPDDLDGDPMLLNCANGVVDLTTGRLRQPRRDDLLTKITKVPYHEDADCPAWLSFLEQVLPNAQVREFVHRAIGYSITGLTDEQVLFFLYGVGQNGKSTFVRTVQEILGDYAKQASPDLMLMDKADSHPTALADLMGTRLVPTIEVDEGKRLAEAQVKWMTGSDKLKARMMRQDYFEFTPTFKLWLASNHRPMVYGRDQAIWRRILMIPFDVIIPPEQRDNKLPTKLFNEAPGIMAWAVRGCLQWQAEGLRPPDVVRAAVEKYKSDMDVLSQFVDECLMLEATSRVTANDLYAAYMGWCKTNGEFTITQRRFSNQMGDSGYNRERGPANKYVWNGIALTAIGHDYQSIGLGVRPFEVASTQSYMSEEAQ